MWRNVDNKSFLLPLKQINKFEIETAPLHVLYTANASPPFWRIAIKYLLIMFSNFKFIQLNIK